MAKHALTRNFGYFFGRLNPSRTFELKASTHYENVKALIEDRRLAVEWSAVCFLQGSYRHETAIYTINDVDNVALCELWDPGQPGPGVRDWSRDEIFDIVAAPLLNDHRYKGKVRYGRWSMCIKLDTDPRIEILPVVLKYGNYDPSEEPFRLYRPENSRWEDGFARDHKALLSWKNREEKTGKNFVPAIKIVKHLRTRFSLNAVSFHLECLLFSLPEHLFLGRPADYIPALLGRVASTPASTWYSRGLSTPCGDRDIFISTEWERQDWKEFHETARLWTECARRANQVEDRGEAISYWQTLLGADFFPRTVSA